MKQVDYGEGASLYLPADVHEERVMEQAWQLYQAEQQRSDFGALLPFTTGAGALGHANPQTIMRELVKADSAIATRAIADRVSSIGLHAFKDTPDGEQVPDPDTRLEDILQTPNPDFSLSQMLYFIAWTLAPAGEAYVQIVHDGIGKPLQLWPLRWDATRPVHRQSISIDHYEVITPNGRTEQLAVEEVIHFWFPDPRDPMRGRGRLTGEAVRWDTARKQDSRLFNFYDRDASARQALEAATGAPAQSISEPERKLFYTMYANRHNRQHGTAMGLPVIAPPGMVFKEFSEPSFDSEVNVKKALSADTFKSMGTPEAILGIVTDVNRANTEGVRFIFDINTIMPIMTLIVGAFNRQLVPQFNDGPIVKHDDFVAEDKEFRLKQELQDLQTKVRAPGEVRATRPDLEEASWAALPVGTLSDTPYTGEVETFTFQNESAADLSGTPPRVEAAGAEGPDVTEHGGGARAGVRAYFAPAAQWQRQLATEEKFTRSTQKLVNRVLRVMQRDVVKNLTVAAEGSGGLEGVTMAQVFTPNDPRWALEWQRQMGPRWREIFEAAGQEVFEGLGIADPPAARQDFALTQAMVKQVNQNIASLVKETGSATWTGIEGVLRKGIEEGASVETIASRITSKSFSAKRARTIARTEIGKANQAGQQQGMESSQVVEGKEWNTAQDAKVRDGHLINGQIVALSGEFTLNTGHKARHPLDPNLPIGQIANCRCFMTPVIDIEED